jgi:hypothetical protein
MGSTSGKYHIQAPPDISKTSWFETAWYSFENFPARQNFEIIGLSSVKKGLFLTIYKSSDLESLFFRLRDKKIHISQMNFPTKKQNVQKNKNHVI